VRITVAKPSRVGDEEVPGYPTPNSDVEKGRHPVALIPIALWLGLEGFFAFANARLAYGGGTAK
jgi:hypothetical protein